MQRIRVLLVEDDEDDAVLVRALLGGIATVAYEVDWVSGFEQAVSAIEQPAHDACLLDYRLGGRDGLELLRLAERCGYPRPIVVLTGHGESEVDEGALAAGAADFLGKAGITGPAIDRSLRYAIRQRQTLEALRASERERRRLSVELLTAQEKERRAVALEIHDSIGQILAAATYVLESALVQRPADRSAATEAVIGKVVGMLRDVIKEASRIQLGLQPAMLDSAGIGPTLSWFCGEFSRTYGIRVEPRIEVAEETIPHPLKATLFRIVQEAFRNAARHSGADTVLLELSAGPQAIRLVVEDHGRGFDERAAGWNDGTGRGLSNMRERALLSGGTFDLRTKPGEGTRLTVTWPATGS